MRVREIVRWQRKNPKLFLTCPRLENASLRANDKLLMSPLPQSSGEEQELMLAPAESYPGVKMNDLELAVGLRHRSLAWASISAHFAYFLLTYRPAIQAIRKP